MPQLITIGEAQIGYYPAMDHGQHGSAGLLAEEKPANLACKSMEKTNTYALDVREMDQVLRESLLDEVFLDMDQSSDTQDIVFAGGSPGIVPLQRWQQLAARKARSSFEKTHDVSQINVPPMRHMVEDRAYDFLHWTCFWIEWAMSSCKYPVIYNVFHNMNLHKERKKDAEST